MARLLIGLLDEAIPALAGCEINDDPLAPICQACRQLVATEGDAAPRRVDWPATGRYGEKLATPDITIADLIGEVDPIKVAEGAFIFSDELTIHYGMLPRTHRGNLRDQRAAGPGPSASRWASSTSWRSATVQIRGYKVRLPLGPLRGGQRQPPRDYTNRGRIITPLKDRFGSQGAHALSQEAGRGDRHHGG